MIPPIEPMPEIPRAFTAFAEWLACLLGLLPLVKRFSAVKFALISFAALVVQVLLMISTGNLHIWFWLPVMALAFAVMYAYIFLGAKISAHDCAYYTIRAFMLAEFTASLEWQINCFIFPYENLEPVKESSFAFPPANMALLFALVFGFTFVLAWLIEYKSRSSVNDLSVSAKELVSAFAIGAGTFAFSNLSFVVTDTPFSGIRGREIMSMRTWIDLVGLAVLYAHYMSCRDYRLKRENMAMHGIMQKQIAQYDSYKDSVDLINRKYHDLKYQIAVLRAENDGGKRLEFLDAMESEIRVFETQNKTGNVILDTILTNKALYCQSRGIPLNCVADGAALEFMDTADIASLFGNALDNAVQSTEKLPDREHRSITLTVVRQKGFLIIRTENSFAGVMSFEDDLPKTTRQNTDYHGYGLKSIRQIAAKYGGVMSIKTEDNRFILQIMLPVSL